MKKYLAIVMTVFGCSTGERVPLGDADITVVDSGVFSDAWIEDAIVEEDGGFDTGTNDGSISPDTGVESGVDSGTMDSGVVDSGTPADAMADTRDSSTIPDSSMPDTAVMDTGTPPPPPSPIVQVAAGTRHTCALRDDGRVVCWGSPGAALGYGETANTSYPVFAIGITDAVHVGAGGEHTCAVRSSGQVSCWGRNGYGEAGAAFSTWRLTPNPVADVTEGVMVAVGADHSCVLNDGLTVDMAQCWGRNNVHQIGNTAAGTSSFAAFWVDGVSDGVEIDSRENRTCIRRPDQTIWCWGGTISATYAMEPVTGVALAVGRAHTCTLRTGPPSVRPGCWGSNTYGQISTSGSGWGTTDAVQIIAGDHHTCARFADDTVWCWGRNSRGQLGTGMDSIGQVFVGLGVPLRASDISAGSNHTCAVTVAGSVVCWGENNDGQLGSGASGMLMSMFPVAVPGV